MASGILMGAGLGAGSAMLTGNDPLKGAALGGAMGGIGGAMSSAPTGVSANTVGQLAAPQMLAQTGTEQAVANASMGGLGNTIGSGFQDATGLTNRDMSQIAIQQMAQPPQQQQQMQVPQTQLRQGQPMQGGGNMMSSNPRLRKQGLL